MRFNTAMGQVWTVFLKTWGKRSKQIHYFRTRSRSTCRAVAVFGRRMLQGSRETAARMGATCAWYDQRLYVLDLVAVSVS